MTIYTRPYAELSSLERAAWYNDTRGEYAASGTILAKLTVPEQMTIEADSAAHPGITRKALAEAAQDFAAMVNGEDSYDELCNF